MADYFAEQNLRLANTLLQKQGEVNALRAERDLYRKAVVHIWQCFGYPTEKNMADAKRVAEEAVPVCETGPTEPGDCRRLCCCGPDAQ